MFSFNQENCQLYFENIIKHMPAHVYWKAIDGTFLYCNDFQAKSAGLMKNEIIGKTDFDMPWKANAYAIRQNDIEIIQSGISQTFEEISVLANGSERFFLSHKSPLRDESNQVIGITGISFDITEQKQLEDALKANKDRTEAVLDNVIANLPGHVYWKDVYGTYIGCNEQQAQSAGFPSRKEMLGKTDLEMPWKEQAKILRNIDLEVMRTANPITVEEPSTLADGKEAIFLSKKEPLYSKQGEIIGILGISFDITEQRRVERELLETRHKLEGMTAVSASIAHELRTPLATIAIGAGSFKRYIPPLVDVYKMALAANLPVPELDLRLLEQLKTMPQSLLTEANAGNVFIDMLLQNIRPSLEGSPIQTFAMSTCIKEALARYPFIGNQKELVTWDSLHDFVVRGKESELIVHVLFNLIKNALFYIADAGKGNIQLWLEPGKPYNQLFFKDTGKGIAPDVLPQIFNRFYSKTRNGAGIGLTYCKMVMENLGGTITCQSELGGYTQFILSFPSID